MWCYIGLVKDHGDDLQGNYRDDFDNLRLSEKPVEGPFETRKEVDEAIAGERHPNSLYTHYLVLQGEIVERKPRL